MKRSIVVGLVVLGLGSAARTSYACSNFYFDKDGYSLMAHNMDWVSGEGMVVINKRHVRKRGFQVENNPDFEWTSRYGSVTLTFDGRESTGRGMNEAGLVILEAALSATQQSRAHTLPLLSVAQWTQYQLDTSTTVDDVIASDKVVRIWPDDMQSHFIVRDKSGTVAVIEWLDGQMTVYQGDTLPVPATVNSTYESCISNGDDPTGRFKIIVDRLASYDAGDAGSTSDGLGYAYSILRDVRNMLPPPVQTLWSVVFDVRAMRLTISTVQNTELRYLDFKDFDFSCQTDVEVLDINGPGSGNVRSAFVPYTTSFNREMVKRTYDIYASYGSQTPEDEIERIIAFPDTTTCADADTRGSEGGADGSVADGGDGRANNDGRQVWDAATLGVVDASGSRNAAGDSGATRATGADAGSSPSGSSSGCACGVGHTARSSTGPVVFLLCLGMVVRRHRRSTVAVGPTTPPSMSNSHP
jgi:penicillin V acylase-like amidase (Ntn superfamily)